MSRCCFVASFLLLTVLLIPSQARTLAQFRIPMFEQNGALVTKEIDVELFDNDKPITVSNFLHYVTSGRYKDGFIHRCDPNFVIQGGGYYVVRRGSADQALDFIESFGPIPNEYGKGTIYSNRYGTIAMAKLGGDTNSATSEWFFNLKDNFGLDAHNDDNFFTVFGRVVSGTNALNTFRNFTNWTGMGTETNVIVDYSFALGAAFSELPFLTSFQAYNDLIYVDISLLNVQIRKVNSIPEISWNSVVGRTNRVEYTTTLPPVWHPLIATNAVGTNVVVQDSNNPDNNRFYRVTIE